VKDRVRAAGKHCGIMSRGADDLRWRIEQGFGMIGLASDAGLVAGGTADAPLRRPPAHMKPDRGEAMTKPGAGPRGDAHLRARPDALARRGHAAMLWVYAGPMPERIVVDERCCTADESPWT
jgi:hypothetical protein